MTNDQKICRRKKQHGFTLAEVTLALIVFLMMTLTFAAVFPVAIRAAHYSNDYAQAALIAQHKVDQLRSAGISNLNYAGLSSLGVVDQNPSATGPSYTFDTVDNLASFFPKNPNGAIGTITIKDYNSLANVTNPPPATEVYICTVTLTWPTVGTTMGSYTTSAMIVSMIHQ
jgi:type II secretory pathway pseudopilin PulG